MMPKPSHNRAAIIDFGSQTTQLIARRIRELKIYCEIFPCTAPIDAIRAFSPAAVILSGGPSSVNEANAPRLPLGLLDLELPTLGICYGMQLYVRELGGEVEAVGHREFGRAEVRIIQESALLRGLGQDFVAWMSHGDQVKLLPDSFRTLAKSATCPHTVVFESTRLFYGVQFHPEVIHTPMGAVILQNFLVNIAGLEQTWEMSSFMQDEVDNIRDRVQRAGVLMALSGGVDSSVAATLIHRAVGKQLHCVYVNHGLHRLSELEEVEALFRDQMHIDLRIVDARQRFFAALEGVVDPEQKRRVIGAEFISVFEEEARTMSDVRFLGQGTLYPDVVESISVHGGPSAVIKTHHNVGALPKRMNLKLVEPLRMLFKDEVRVLGAKLGLPQSLLMRQPFPGPGLAVRILGEVRPERCALLAKADAIVRGEIEKLRVKGLLPETLWQWFAVLLPIRSVGVMGDARTYGETIVVRCLESVDGMTADFSDLPKAVLGRISNRIINEVQGISRVVYDISSKPPATIEWE